MYEMLKVAPLKPCEPSLAFQVWCNSTESWEKGQPLYRVMSVSRPEKLYYHLRRGSESWWFALTHIFTEAEIVGDTIGFVTRSQDFRPVDSASNITVLGLQRGWTGLLHLFSKMLEEQKVQMPSAKGHTLWFCHIQNVTVSYNSIYMGRQTMQLRSAPPDVTAWITQKWMNK